MPDTDHPNYVAKFDASPELLDDLWEKTTRDLIDAKETERRKAEWPSEVNKALNTLAARVGALETRFDAPGVGQS